MINFKVCVEHSLILCITLRYSGRQRAAATNSVIDQVIMNHSNYLTSRTIMLLMTFAYWEDLLIVIGYMRCLGTKCPLLTAFFSLSPTLTFLQEVVIVGF